MGLRLTSLVAVEPRQKLYPTIEMLPHAFSIITKNEIISLGTGQQPIEPSANHDEFLTNAWFTTFYDTHEHIAVC